MNMKTTTTLTVLLACVLCCGFIKPRVYTRPIPHRPPVARKALPPPPKRHLPPPAPRHHWHPAPLAPWYFASGLLLGTAIQRPTVIQVGPTVQNAEIITSQAISSNVIWIQGKYVDEIFPDGTIRRVWIPGHWETVP